MQLKLFYVQNANHISLFPSCCVSAPISFNVCTFTKLRHHTQQQQTLYDFPSRVIKPSDLYLTTHNIHKGKTSVVSVGFFPAIRSTK